MRVHSKKQISQIAGSIRQFGFASPIVADEKGTILAGHGRWHAAKQLALPLVPVVVLSGLSEAERRAYVLADNKLTENAGWDRAGLARELDELAPLLAEAGLDLGLTGFETPEIDRLLSDLVDPENDPTDETPAMEGPPVSRRGDLWLLDKHHLYCGDAKDDYDLHKLMGRERAAMVFADPPYNVPVALIQGRGKIRHREFMEGPGGSRRRPSSVSSPTASAWLQNILSPVQSITFAWTGGTSWRFSSPVEKYTSS